MITNKYLISEKFVVLKNGFLNAAKELSINLESIDNFCAQGLINSSLKYDFVLFYDKDIKLAMQLEKTGYKLFNKSSAIAICDDKFLTYNSLENVVPQPMTISAPFTFYGNLSEDNEFIKKCEEKFSYPMIVKECYGSFGFQVYKIDKREQLFDCIKNIGNKAFIIQEYIKTSFACDLRLQVVGDEVVSSIQRVNKNGDFRANITNGAIANIYDATDEQKRIAITATKSLGLDFAGVDLLFGENDQPLLCEVNSNAHIENIGRICNINVYKKILAYIISKVK